MKYSLLPVAMAVLLGFIACKSDNKNNENMKQELTLTQEWDKKFRTARRRGAHLHQLHPIEYNNMKKIFLFGAMVCGKTKIIHTYSVCTAKRHDSQETDKVLVEPPVERWDEPAMFDAGYVGMEDVVRAKHMTPVICERGTKDHPLTATQKESNRLKSKTRCRVEHVFGFMEQTMSGLIFRGVGMVRAKACIALTNLVYNMCHLVQIKKYHLELVVC